MKRTSHPHIGKTIEINFKTLYAAMVGTGGYFIFTWATANPQWWGFGLLGVFMFLVALSLLFNVARTAVDLYRLKTHIKEKEALGAPTNATLLSDEELRKNGAFNRKSHSSN